MITIATISLILSLLAAPNDDITTVKELYKEGRFSEAHARLLKVPATKENVAEILLYRGLLEDEAEKSIAYFQKLLDEYPETEHRHQARYMIAMHTFLEKSYKEAISSFKMVTESKDDSVHYGRACLWIARCYEALFDTSNAISWYEKIEQSDSASFAIAQEILKFLTKTSSVYSIQIGSFQSRESAQELAATYAEKGYETWLATTQKDGIKYYRVLIGEFDSKDMAKGFLELFSEKEQATFWIIKIKRL